MKSNRTLCFIRWIGNWILSSF